MEETIEMLELVLAQDKLFSLGAKMMKKTVDALTAEGFSREEAITITAAQGGMVKSN